MILRHATPEDMKIAKKIYKDAFPFVEKKPWCYIKHCANKGKYDVLVGYDEGQITGLILGVPYKDMVLFDYLAVNKDIRSKGYGSEILRLAEKHYEGLRLLLVAEIEDENAPNNEQRIARMKFYAKNGWKRSGLLSVATSGNLEMLTKAGDVTKEEYIALNRYSLGKVMMKLCKMHMVELPKKD